MYKCPEIRSKSLSMRFAYDLGLLSIGTKLYQCFGIKEQKCLLTVRFEN